MKRGPEKKLSMKERRVLVKAFAGERIASSQKVLERGSEEEVKHETPRLQLIHRQEKAEHFLMRQ